MPIERLILILVLVMAAAAATIALALALVDGTVGIAILSLIAMCAAYLWRRYSDDT